MIGEDPRFERTPGKMQKATLQKKTAILAIGKAGLKPLPDIRIWAFADCLLARQLPLLLALQK